MNQLLKTSDFARKKQLQNKIINKINRFFGVYTVECAKFNKGYKK